MGARSTAAAAQVFPLLLAACGGAPAAPPPPREEPPPPRTSPALPPAAEEGLAVMRRYARAVREHDLATLRAHADPERGTWFWAAPGFDPVPCTWLDPVGEGDPFAAETQSCTGRHVLDHLAPTLDAALAVADVDRGAYAPPGADAIDAAPPWGSFDLRADLSRLRVLADAARASRSVRAAIDGQPIEHAFRAEHGRASVTVYLTVRAEAAYVAHVVADVHDVWAE